MASFAGERAIGWIEVDGVARLRQQDFETE